MLRARRRRLEGITPTSSTHPGLWLDRYLSKQVPRDAGDSGRGELLGNLLGEAAGIAIPDLYRQAFERWKAALDAVGTHTRSGTVVGRLIVGLGDESVWENATTLHHTYGVPIIPGSALKGVAAHYARAHLTEEWAAGSRAYDTLFGTTDRAGLVTFFDAWLDPRQSANTPLHPDVMTVHHQNYYRGDPVPPADWDSPNPIQFLSATGSYLLALSGPGEWVQSAFDILELALKEVGVGAKTSSGYGRLVVR